MTTKRKLKRIFKMTQPHWDNGRTRPGARRALRNALACQETNGALLFQSATEERLVFCTCKSPACPSCGQRARGQWLRELLATLPNIPYMGITLTMPDVLWLFFRDNRKLLRVLPSLGAKVITDIAKEVFGAELLVLVVPHTFSRYMTFNIHLHILVSAIGLDERSCSLVPIYFNREDLMSRWRKAVSQLLLKALHAGQLSSRGIEDRDFTEMISAQESRWWSIDIKHCHSKAGLLGYIMRYARHPPIAEHRIISVTDVWVVFWTNDHRSGRRTETYLSPELFIDRLIQHIPDYYQHSVRSYGLLSPRGKRRVFDLFFLLLEQARRPRPGRIPWSVAVKRLTGRDPLRDSKGNGMRLARYLTRHQVALRTGNCAKDEICCR